jgi:hypothetical protein
VPASDQCRLGIFAAVVHLADVFRSRIDSDTVVVTTVSLADEVQYLARPARPLTSRAPEQGTDLGVFQRGIGSVEKGVHRLGRGGVSVGRAVPVVDDPVVGRNWHRLSQSANARLWRASKTPMEIACSIIAVAAVPRVAHLASVTGALQSLCRLAGRNT